MFLTMRGSWRESDAERLEEICLEVETRQEIHILMVTTEDTGGKTQQDYADDFYDSVYPEESEKNGVLVLIDIGERELWISTAGIMRYYLSDREIDDLLDHMYEEASAEDYAGAFERAAEDIRLSIERGISTGDYLIDENGNVTQYRSITPVEIGLCGGGRHRRILSGLFQRPSLLSEKGEIGCQRIWTGQRREPEHRSLCAGQPTCDHPEDSAEPASRIRRFRRKQRPHVVQRNQSRGRRKKLLRQPVIVRLEEQLPNFDLNICSEYATIFLVKTNVFLRGILR